MARHGLDLWGGPDDDRPRMTRPPGADYHARYDPTPPGAEKRLRRVMVLLAIFGVLVVLGLIADGFRKAAACEFPSPHDLRSVARIIVPDGTGTGFIVGDTFVTAGHVPGAARMLQVLVQDERSYQVRVDVSVHSGEMDFALAAAPEPGTLEFVDDVVRLYEPIVIAGFPLGHNQLPMFVTEGRYMGDFNGFGWASANVLVGVSGGPVLVCRDGRWKVAGVAIASVTIEVTRRRPLPWRPAFAPVPYIAGFMHTRDLREWAGL